MASAVTRFECLLPLTVNGSSDYNAIETFKANIAGLCPTFYYPVYDQTNPANSFWAFFGYITATQQATALGFLNTLNAALSAGLTPVKCVVWNGTTEP